MVELCGMCSIPVILAGVVSCALWVVLCALWGGVQMVRFVGSVVCFVG